MNETPTVLEKTLTEEKKPDVEVVTVQQTPQAIPGMIQSTKEAAPVVLSQAPPFSPSDPKPVVDKPSSIVDHPLGEKK